MPHAANFLAMAAESITTWIGHLRAGDHVAAERLWNEYFQRLVALARVKLGNQPRRVADEEDLALSAFHSLCIGAERGRFSNLHDRDNLWQLLATITARKAAHLARDATRHKRGGGSVRGESAFIDSNGDSEEAAGMESIIGNEPTPEFATQLAEEYDRLLASLKNSELASIARWRMEGYSTAEIAEKLDKSAPTIERKLRAIRTIWEAAGAAA
jgi:DNA-directed RNA polymerase specialized sigma24 family protein